MFILFCSLALPFTTFRGLFDVLTKREFGCLRKCIVSPFCRFVKSIQVQARSVSVGSAQKRHFLQKLVYTHTHTYVPQFAFIQSPSVPEEPASSSGHVNGAGSQPAPVSTPSSSACAVFVEKGGESEREWAGRQVETHKRRECNANECTTIVDDDNVVVVVAGGDNGGGGGG
ncbi:unnamed protein product [Protopolystoma xenopodis]|uniref:Secreted protein n=1 Tax=Protopolystoma xenopodis TaxID=117903 RepID=A0A3S5CJN2_9PLAT|nr:unnamed protein product [Protopolystoma xenopodis]